MSTPCFCIAALWIFTNLVPAIAQAQTAAPAPPSVQVQPPVTLCGTIEQVNQYTLTLRDRSGEVFTLQRPVDMNVTEVIRVAPSEIKTDSYVSIASIPQLGDHLLALYVLLFPEEARGAGAGHRPYDLQPQSTITNATIAGISIDPALLGSKQLLLRYPGGEKTILVTPDTPVVVLRAAIQDQKTLIVPGARIVLTAQMRDGRPMALHLIAGRNGFSPPM